MLTFEVTPIQGVSAIIEKLTVRFFSPFKLLPPSNRIRLLTHYNPNLIFCYAVVTLPESATQSDNARRTAFFPDRRITHCERDWPPLGESHGLLFFVIDTHHPPSVQVDDSPNPLQFSQVFHLIPDGGSYYVYVNPRFAHYWGTDKGGLL